MTIIVSKWYHGYKYDSIFTPIHLPYPVSYGRICYHCYDSYVITRLHTVKLKTRQFVIYLPNPYVCSRTPKSKWPVYLILRCNFDAGTWRVFVKIKGVINLINVRDTK